MPHVVLVLEYFAPVFRFRFHFDGRAWFWAVLFFVFFFLLVFCDHALVYSSFFFFFLLPMHSHADPMISAYIPKIKKLLKTPFNSYIRQINKPFLLIVTSVRSTTPISYLRGKQQSI